MWHLSQIVKILYYLCDESILFVQQNMPYSPKYDWYTLLQKHLFWINANRHKKNKATTKLWNISKIDYGGLVFVFLFSVSWCKYTENVIKVLYKSHY